MHIYIFWVNCNYSRPHCDLTGIMVNKGNHPQMALIQLSEILAADRSTAATHFRLS